MQLTPQAASTAPPSGRDPLATATPKPAISPVAAIGGAFTAPTLSVVPGMGVDEVVLYFAVEVVGGLGSLPGAALGALMVGLVRSASIHYMPQVELFVIYFVMAMVLAFRPRGLFSLAEPRKI
mgnify:CR=1 FL=1